MRFDTIPACGRQTRTQTRTQHSVARVTRSSATADGPRDALYQSKSCELLHNCMNNCTTKPQQIEVTEGYGRLSCNQPCATSHDAYTVVGVIHKLDRRQVFTARCYASAVLAMGLCLSVGVRGRVRLSVTSRSSTKTAKRTITQTTPHDSPGTLVF